VGWESVSSDKMHKVDQEEASSLLVDSGIAQLGHPRAGTANRTTSTTPP
jgi:hypothetical protein